MTLKPLRIIAVGRLREPFWKAAAEHYNKRLRYWRAVYETIVKDGDASFPIPKRNAMEGKEILAKLEPIDIPICLDEKGKAMTSQQFALFLEHLSENTTSRPCFILGGAFGLDERVRDISKHLFSLSQTTLPHELARIVLLEQLYRAETLLHNLPYHH